MTAPAHPRARVAAGVAVIGALWLLGLNVGGLDTGLLFLAPAFVLALPLLAGRYVGETVFARAGRSLGRRPPSLHRALRPPAKLLPRGGMLVGVALAGRAPPA
jgi:hypothetical protein